MALKKKRKYGWLPQRPDHRDIPYRLTKAYARKLPDIPDSADLRPFCPPVYDQGDLGSCTANAICAAYSMEAIKQYEANDTNKDFEINYDRFTLSRLFLYYRERLAEGTVNSDTGAFIRDGIKVLAAGVPLEVYWRYEISQFSVAPPKAAYDDSTNHKALLYAAVDPNHLEICTALADGYPVVFGFTVYESFESEEVAKTGIVPLPKNSEGVVGGHAVCAVGYDRTAQMFYVRNSWGEEWGQKGYCLMPFSYLETLASDFWVIKTVK